MDKVDYIEKAETIVSTYETTTRNPTPSKRTPKN